MKQHEKTNMSVQGLPTSNLINHSYAEAERKTRKKKRKPAKIVEKSDAKYQKNKKTKRIWNNRSNSPGKSEQGRKNDKRMLGRRQKIRNSGLKNNKKFKDLESSKV